MTAEEFIEKFKFPGQAGYDLISVANAKTAIGLAKKDNPDIQIVLDAMKKWILSENKDLDEPYYHFGKEAKSLRDILKDIEECNDSAIELVKIMINMTCTFFIKPIKFAEEVKQIEQALDVNCKLNCYLNKMCHKEDCLKYQEFKLALE